MTNCEAIKKMNAAEMGAVFYIFLKPIMDAYEFTPEQRETIKQNISTFLNTEV